MDVESTKKFLKEAGLSNTEQIKDILKETLGLRRKRHIKEETYQLSSIPLTNHNPSQIQSNYKRIGYLKPEYKPQTFKTDLMNFKKGKSKEHIEAIKQKIKVIEFLYEKVANQGGIIELLSSGKWDEITRLTRQSRQQFRSRSDQEILQFYLTYLIEFQMMSVGTPLNVRKGVQLDKTLKNATFIHSQSKGYLKCRQLQQQMINQQIVVIQNAVEALNLQDVTLQKINQQCGLQNVELRIQNPLDYGFNPYKLTNKDDKMTIGEYCQYQKHFEDENYCREKFGDKLKGGKVFFAVNFQPDSGTLLDTIKDRLKDTLFGWTHQDDILSYLQQHINGCTNAQFYLKVRGVWTGGHQENLNMCAVNINHGPSDSQWYTVAGEDVERLRKTLKQKFKQDLYQHQGLWFQKINWFIENGFRITRIIQKPGDMVISGPGTLHWVRAYGVSLHSAWNIFPQRYKMLACAYHRQYQNQKIRFRKSNIIPFKTLTLKQLQHKLFVLCQEQKQILLIHLKKWLYQQQSLMKSVQLHYNPLGLQVVQKQLEEHLCFCKLCLQEIFVYYVEVEGEENKVLCLNCLIETDPYKANLVVYHKYNVNQLSLFLGRATLNQIEDGPLKYCSGEHIGKTCIRDLPQNHHHNIKLNSKAKNPSMKLKTQTKVQSRSIQVQTQIIMNQVPKEKKEQQSKPRKKVHKNQQKQLGQISQSQERKIYKASGRSDLREKQPKDTRQKQKSKRDSSWEYYDKNRSASKGRSRSRDKKTNKNRQEEDRQQKKSDQRERKRNFREYSKQENQGSYNRSSNHNNGAKNSNKDYKNNYKNNNYDQSSSYNKNERYNDNKEQIAAKSERKRSMSQLSY